jgi:hypothetical protein
MKGILTVEAENDQEARKVAFAQYMEEGIVWKYVETDEEYDPRIVEVDPL